MVTLHPPSGPVRARIALPGSKSVANRALVCAALAGETSVVKGLPEATDTRILHQLLQERPARMHCGLGGTTLRFALAWAAVQEGEERLVTGEAALLARPHHGLVQALCELGAAIDTTASGFVVKGRRLRGGPLVLDSPPSSQFLSALMLVAPSFEQGLELRWTGRQLSRPYVHMTAAVMQAFGVKVEANEDVIRVLPGTYAPETFTVPPDWSAAAFWFQVAALVPGSELLLEGLRDDGLQGDAQAAVLFAPWTTTEQQGEGLLVKHRSGGKEQHRSDLRDTPDLFQPLAMTCAGRGEGAVLTGLDNLHLKESDRLAAVQEALERLGAQVQVEGGTFTLEAGQLSTAPEAPFDPQHDHRMAMSLAPLAAVCGALRIADPEVVTKSYPAFWRHLEQAGFRVER